jgi:2-oxoacid dehydrogenases acyltransferase (catalytic domain)
LSLPRLWANDYVHFAARSPTVGGTFSIRVRSVAAARRKCQPLIGWAAILTKAMALTAGRWPELRQCYMPLPWPHLYEHPCCVANLVLEREWRGEQAIFCDQIRAPESISLREIDDRLRTMKGAQIDALGGFRRIIRITGYPLLVRRLLWSLVLKGSGRLRARYFGTFCVNLLAGRNMHISQSVTLHAISLFHGPLQPDGIMKLHVFFDHRVIDGARVARWVADLEATLGRDVVAELASGLQSQGQCAGVSRATGCEQPASGVPNVAS